MAIAPFLAMTAAEFCAAPTPPSKIAWMACHFSPYGLGLSNLPKELPPGSLLMVDDVTPPYRHDPAFIAEQLSMRADVLQCSGILLDFQRGGCSETQSMVKHLISALPYPVVVSECYAQDLDCPVILSPVPPSAPLEEYLLPWKGRKIWIELGLEGEILTLTESGCQVTPFPHPDLEVEGFRDEALYCHYSIQTEETSARFTLWRTQDDLMKLLEETESMGIKGVVGLYQELDRYAALQKALPIGEGGSRNG